MYDLQLKDVTKHFGPIKTLDSLTLKARKGELLAVLGPSGCGKSAILYCVAGIETPDSGDILLRGQTVFSDKEKTNIPPEERNLGLVFQS